MSFSEFLDGTGQAILREHMPSLQKRIAPPAALHEALLAQVRLYCLVGGMPEAVARFAETGSLAEVSPIHRRLMSGFRQDIPKYHRRADVNLVEQLFDAVPQTVGTQIKYTSLIPGVRIEKIKAALQLLEQGLLVHRVRENPASALPLGATASEHRFKMIMLDIGLMQHLCGIPPTDVLLAESFLDVFRGALAEQFVGQQLLSSGLGSEQGKLYYWARQAKGSSAEVDYVIARAGKIHPVEVKSGAAGKLKSITLFLGEHRKSGEGLVLSGDELRGEPDHRLLRLPLYSELR